MKSEDAIRDVLAYRNHDTGKGYEHVSRYVAETLLAEVDRLRRAVNEIALRTSPYRDQWDEWPLVAGIAQVAQDAGGNAYVGEQSRATFDHLMEAATKYADSGKIRAFLRQEMKQPQNRS